MWSPSITGRSGTSLRCLAASGCRVTVVPATATADDILRHKPDGVFLSNGPGDPAATAEYAVPAAERGRDGGRVADLRHLPRPPIAGARAGGADLQAGTRGHHGANQPVKDLATGKVEITSQNHGFAVDEKTLPEGVTVTHRSLFDGQQRGHCLPVPPRLQRCSTTPEASPGPSDSHHLFDRFMAVMEA